MSIKSKLVFVQLDHKGPIFVQLDTGAENAKLKLRSESEIRETWATPVFKIWDEFYGGDPINFSKDVKMVKQLIEKIGVDEFCRGLRRYCSDVDILFQPNLRKYVSGYKAWLK